jgi:hypothetical protein
MNRPDMIVRAALAAAVLIAPAGTAAAADLRGSPASMVLQHSVAKKAELPFLSTSAQVRELVAGGGLVEVPGNEDYTVLASQPFALPEVKLLIERLSRQYRAANGEKLVVTSLTRPTASQPSNAHRLSVHPAGMAIDLRVPAKASARLWLESTLLSLEAKGVLDATRERRPPHYHLAVFPAAYAAYVEKLDANKPVMDVESAPSLEMAGTAVAATAEQAEARPDSPAMQASIVPGGNDRPRSMFGALVAVLMLVSAASGARFLGLRKIRLRDRG